jgi:hypothetical protein
MKQKAYQVASSVTLVFVMAAFLSTMFFADVTLSFAASENKKSSAVARTSAVEHTETQIKQLQGALTITKEQEELWNTLIQVMRENAKKMDDLAKERADNTKPMNAVEHMKFHSQITEANLDQQKKFIPHFEALYVSMSDDQKKSTDTIFRTGIFAKSKRK